VELRRSKLEVLQGILLVAIGGARKTEIVYKASLTFTRAKNHLDFLEKQNLLKKEGNRWITTAKGLDFLKNFNKVKQHLQPLQVAAIYETNSSPKVEFNDNQPNSEKN